MPSTERLIDGRFAKWLAIAGGVVPAVLLAWDASRGGLGVNSVNFAIRTTGMIGLVLLVLTLLITPLRALTGWNTLVAMRRNFGVLAFCYLAAHFSIFFLLDRQASVSSTLSEIGMRRYLWFGAGALALMIPLALTSTDAMVSRLGPKRWKALHRLTYLIAIAAVVHYYLLVKSDVRLPLAFAGAVGLLLGYRLVNHYVQLRAAARKGSQTAAARTPKAKSAFWKGELEIARIFDESHDVKTFRFVPVDGGPLPFAHTAGQYLNLQLEIDGQRVNRSYTIASSAARNGYCEISVKHTPNGYGSRHLHTTWREGQRVKVSAAAGRFVFRGDESDHVIMIAGGIGVTPMMSVVRSLTDRGWRGRMDLLFSVRAVRDFVFRDELEYLQARFPNLRVRTLVSADPDTPWDGARGQITREVIEEFIPGIGAGPVLLCGPPPMMTAMRQIVVAMGVPDAQVFQEEFVSPPMSTSDTAADPVSLSGSGAAMAGGDDGRAATVAFAKSGTSAELSAEQTVLEAAEDNGIAIPFECRSGICGQCKTRLIEGSVHMDVEDALTEGDRVKGFILACQARPIGDIQVDA